MMKGEAEKYNKTLELPILAFNDFLGAISRCTERLQKVEERRSED